MVRAVYGLRDWYFLFVIYRSHNLIASILIWSVTRYQDVNRDFGKIRLHKIWDARRDQTALMAHEAFMHFTADEPRVTFAAARQVNQTWLTTIHVSCDEASLHLAIAPFFLSFLIWSHPLFYLDSCFTSDFFLNYLLYFNKLENLELNGILRKKFRHAGWILI